MNSTETDQSADPGSGALPSLTPGHKLAFTLINASTVPVWLAMILFPQAAITRWLVGRCTVVFAGLGLTYTALLGASLVQSGEMIDFRDADSVRNALANPTAFLAGWTHFLAFDLFVGRWIWESNQTAGRTARVPLLLTWWFGPIGLTTELARRARRP